MFNVNLWGSHPDLENDDCWTGEEFATEAEARAFFLNPWTDAKFAGYFMRGTEYLELDGPEVHEARRNSEFRPSKPDRLWENEIRMQAAMMGDY